MKPSTPSQTAERVALTRAIESLLPDKRRICSDHLARHFLTGRMHRAYRVWVLRRLFCWMSDRRLPGVMGAVLVRTRFMDDYLLEQAASGIPQVVNLGAGYDTRAFRFNTRLKQATIFEIDHPATQERKRALARRFADPLPDNVIFVPVRFNTDDLKNRLIAAGFQPDRKTAFIWEGVTYYITPRAVDTTLAFVARHSPAGSSIVFDFLPASVADRTSSATEARRMHALFDRLGEGITFGVSPERMPAFLSERGLETAGIFSCRRLYGKYLAEGRRKVTVSKLFSIAHAAVPEKRRA